MDLQHLLALQEQQTYHEKLRGEGGVFEERLQMLRVASTLFKSKKRLSDMTLSERCIFLGRTTRQEEIHDFDTNLFGAPGGNGEVKRMISNQYHHLDGFFMAIPRLGEITQAKFKELVQQFHQGCQAGGSEKKAFVFLTRILTVSRPDFFVSAAADALKPICKALEVGVVGTDPDKYWRLLQSLHQLPVFLNSVNDVSSFDIALLDSAIWAESETEQSNEVQSTSASYHVEENKMMTLITPASNQILYGPPGTGKTYHTIEAAVKAAEPSFYSSLNIDHKVGATAGQRELLQERYRELSKVGHIRFVTFHQSYGYEEFVEGISASTNDEKSISYSIKPGVFKQICDAARLSSQTQNESINPEGRVWKISIEGTYENSKKTYCLNNNLAAIGWDDTGDLSKNEQNEYFKGLGRNDQNSLMYFSQEMSIGDLVLCINSNTSVEAVGVVSGDYQFVESGIAGKGYAHHLPVNWLKTGFSVNFQSINANKRFNLPTCYPLSRLSVSETISHLLSHDVDINDQNNTAKHSESYVLVIDEINRGNISKIFGELITLIEASKRQGQPEALELLLPHSGKHFSVPSNLHIIGTMNTADRSLAMMDTALRRRFDFVEMMPKPELLKGVLVKGIDLCELLKVLNQRIEILYDREHTLGHAFFMPVKALLEEGKEDLAFTQLKSVFQNKVIPLLEEYFFEDWSKIRLVLADNQKPEGFQFVLEKTKKNSALNDLFGKGHKLDEYGQTVIQYILADNASDVWEKVNAYIGIYQTLNEKKADKEEPANEGDLAEEEG